MNSEKLNQKLRLGIFSNRAIRNKFTFNQALDDMKGFFPDWRIEDNSEYDFTESRKLIVHTDYYNFELELIYIEHIQEPIVIIVDGDREYINERYRSLINLHTVLTKENGCMFSIADVFDMTITDLLSVVKLFNLDLKVKLI